MKKILLLATLLTAPSLCLAATQLNGAGATFPFPLYSKWFDEYRKVKPEVTVNYNSIGSGGGIKALLEGTVDFGASDAPMNEEEMKKSKSPVVHVPTVLGAVVLSYNLPSLTKPLNLSGEVIAEIFLGKITKWNDAKISDLNKGVQLPETDILVAYRSDGSGTTSIFTDYLSKVSAEWKSTVGAAASVEWPVGVGAKGNDGVAGNVGQTKNSIGYVEYAYAKQNKLTHVDLMNKAGKHVSPTIAAFQAAAANADWAKAEGYYVILTDQAGDQSWPLTAATFILMHAEPQDKAATTEALKFFGWAFAKGDKMAEELDYIPMPDSVVKLIEATWAKDIKNK